MKAKYVITSLAVFSFFVIPLRGQSETIDPNKLAADQTACQQHAMASSGYNRVAPTQQEVSSTPPQRGAGLRGAARGAAAGAVTGEVVERVGDEGEHDDAAEVGAAVGAVTGGLKARRNAKNQAPPPASVPAGDPALYTKQYNECMTSRGHVIQ